MNQIQDIAIVPSQVGNETIQTINARDLHEFLESRQEFSNWIKSRIGIGFIEDKDFLIMQSKSTGGRPATEYHITLDMAKHLAMVERNDKGHEARTYFIGIEKKYREIVKPVIPQIPHTIEEKAELVLDVALRIAQRLKVPEHLAVTESVKFTKNQTGVDFSGFLPYSETQNNILEHDMMLEVTEIGKQCDLSGKAVNKILLSKNYQVKNGELWIPTAKAEGLFTRHHWNNGKKTGYNLKWNMREVLKIIRR